MCCPSRCGQAVEFRLGGSSPLLFGLLDVAKLKSPMFAIYHNLPPLPMEHNAVKFSTNYFVTYYKAPPLSAISQEVLDRINKNFRESLDPTTTPPQTRQNHQNTLSQASKNKIRSSVNVMAFMRSKGVQRGFREGRKSDCPLAFLTLTLPSLQKHPTREITSKCLSVFLQNLRNQFQTPNYVWVAEYQENANVHYHLVIDRFISHRIVRTLWNRCIEKLGYVSAYTEKFSEMSLGDYTELRNQKSKTNPKRISDAYNLGKLEGWRNPNSTDVKGISNEKQIGAYISKYLSKGITGAESFRSQIEERDGGTYALWGRSQSLSRIKMPIYSIEDVYASDVLLTIYHEAKLIKASDWFSTYSIKVQSPKIRSYYDTFLYNTLIKDGYIIA